MTMDQLDRIDRTILKILARDGRISMAALAEQGDPLALGVITDANLVPDPETIAHHFEQEFARLHAATELRSATDEHR